jgi:cell division septation protein DedD
VADESAGDIGGDAPKPVAAPAKPKPKPATTPTGGGGGAMVQIGAFSSSALADKGWQDADHALPGLTAGKTKSVEAVQKDGKTFYRTSVGGFASRADAASYCTALKAAGHSCFVK